MADIYQYASLTLAATSSSGDSEGCYPDTSALAADLEINIPDDIGACRIAVRRPLKHWDNLTPSQVKKHFPLLSRGWAFQERLLSPRVLHFSESELVWECRQLCICECGGLAEESSPGGTYYSTIRDSEEEINRRAVAQQEQMDELMAVQLQQQEDDWELAMRLQNEDLDARHSSSEVGNSWAAIPPPDPLPPASIVTPVFNESSASSLPTYNQTETGDAREQEYPRLMPHFHRLVEQYSALGLTKQTDRLPALSGLCKRIQYVPLTTYFTFTRPFAGIGADPRYPGTSVVTISPACGPTPSATTSCGASLRSTPQRKAAPVQLRTVAHRGPGSPQAALSVTGVTFPTSRVRPSSFPRFRREWFLEGW